MEYRAVISWKYQRNWYIFVYLLNCRVLNHFLYISSMDRGTQLNELQQIYKEYSHFFDECTLIKDDPSIHIVDQGFDDKVSVDITGWYQTKQAKHYESFEALMSTVCPGFLGRFGNELMSKLQGLLS